MILKKVIAQVIREPSGGEFKDSTKWTLPDIEAKIHYARASVMQTLFSKTKRLGSDWMQSFSLTFDRNIQNTDSEVRFSCPDIVTLDDLRDGLTYVGSNENTQYTRVNNRADLANFNSHRSTRITEDSPVFIYEQGYIILFGATMIKSVFVSGVFALPTDVPTYNQDMDDYPISEDLIPLIKDFIFKSSTAIEAQTQNK